MAVKWRPVVRSQPVFVVFQVLQSGLGVALGGEDGAVSEIIIDAFAPRKKREKNGQKAEGVGSNGEEILFEGLLDSFLLRRLCGKAFGKGSTGADQGE